MPARHLNKPRREPPSMYVVAGITVGVGLFVYGCYRFLLYEQEKIEAKLEGSYENEMNEFKWSAEKKHAIAKVYVYKKTFSLEKLGSCYDVFAKLAEDGLIGKERFVRYLKEEEMCTGSKSEDYKIHGILLSKFSVHLFDTIAALSPEYPGKISFADLVLAMGCMIFCIIMVVLAMDDHRAHNRPGAQTQFLADLYNLHNREKISEYSLRTIF